jgi:hypothetical protein
MHDIIECLTRRKPLNSISTDQLIQMLINPDINPNFQKIQLLRRTPRGDQYDRIKESMLCVTPNATFNGWVESSSAINPSGFVYVDLDLKEGMDYEREFIVLKKNPHLHAAWMSAGGNGIGALVHVEWTDTNEDNFKTAWMEAMSDLTGHGTNPAAIDRSVSNLGRVNVLSFHPDLYYNPNSTSITKPDFFVTGMPTRRIIKEVTGDPATRKKIRFQTDLDDWNESEAYRYIPEGKDFTHLYFGNHKIHNLQRSNTLFEIACWTLSINPGLSEKELCAWVSFFNSTRCILPLLPKEVIRIGKSAYKTATTKGVYAPSRKKKVWFNPAAKLSPHEKMSISAKVIGKQRRHNTLEKLEGFIQELREKNVKITQKSLSEAACVHLRTVKRYWDELKELIW